MSLKNDYAPLAPATTLQQTARTASHRGLFHIAMQDVPSACRGRDKQSKCSQSMQRQVGGRIVNFRDAGFGLGMMLRKTDAGCLQESNICFQKHSATHASRSMMRKMSFPQQSSSSLRLAIKIACLVYRYLPKRIRILFC